MSLTNLLVPRQVQTIIDEGIANNDLSGVTTNSCWTPEGFCDNLYIRQFKGLPVEV